MPHLPKRHADRFKGAGYKTITEALQTFNDLGCLPEDVTLTHRDDCDGLEPTFVSERAKFHSACVRSQIQTLSYRKIFEIWSGNEKRPFKLKTTKKGGSSRLVM